MRLRTRRADQRVKTTKQYPRAVVGNSDEYLAYPDDASIVKADGTLVFEASLELSGTYLVGIDLTDSEFEQLVEARLRIRPAASFAAVGRAMTSATKRLRDRDVTDVLENMGLRERASW